MNIFALSDPELHTILAALRTYQANGYGNPSLSMPGDLALIATNHGEHLRFDDNCIDTLCQRLNAGRKIQFEIIGPDGIGIFPEPFEDLNEVVAAAAAFPLRFLHQGYFLDFRKNRIPIEDLPRMLELVVIYEDPDEE